MNSNHNISDATLEKLRDMLSKKEKISELFNFQVEALDVGYSRLSMVIDENMCNIHGVCHGGVTFTFCDTAFGMACSMHNRVTFGVNCTIDYVSPALIGDKLTVECKQIFAQKRSGIYDAEVKNQDGKTVVIFRGNTRSRDDLIVPVESE